MGERKIIRSEVSAQSYWQLACILTELLTISLGNVTDRALIELFTECVLTVTDRSMSWSET
jgi:hypothetical protein